MKKALNHILLFLILVIPFFTSGSSLHSYNSFNDLYRFETFESKSKQIKPDDVSLVISPLSMHVSMSLPFTPRQMFNYNNETNQYDIILGDLSAYSAKMNRFSLEGAIQIFGVKGVNDKFGWSASIRDRFFAGFGFSKSLIDFVNKGNKHMPESEMILKLSAYHFRSYSFSLYRKMSHQTNVGLTGHLYFGKSWINVAPEILVSTQAHAEYIDVAIRANGKISMPFTLSNLTRGFKHGFPYFKSLFMPLNPGLGVDMHFNYRCENGLKWNVSVNDLGFIVWHSNASSAKIKADSDHRWEGIDFSGRLDLDNFNTLRESDEFIAIRNDLWDQLIDTEKSAFVTLSPLTMQGSVWQKNTDGLSAGINIDAAFLRNYLRLGFSLLGSFNMTDKISLMGGISVSEKAAFSMPLSISLGNDNFSALIVLDNLVGVIAPDFTRTYGGGFQFVFRYVPRQKRYIIDSSLPFYRMKAQRN